MRLLPSPLSCIAEALDAELLLHIFASYCRPSEILRFGETSSDAHELVLVLPISLSRFPLGSLVRVKDEAAVLHALGAANRGDLTAAGAAQAARLEGLVVGRHPTNGVGVLLLGPSAELPEPLWLEPMCLVHVGRPPPREAAPDIRLFPGQKVRVDSPSSRYQGTVGTVELRCALPVGVHGELLVRFAGQSEELLDVNVVTPVTRFFGGTAARQLQEQGSDAVLSLMPFFLGCHVRVLEKDAVLASFDTANRDDYFDYMDAFCGRVGVVDQLHPTNGVRVAFMEPPPLWYEPPGLQLLGTEEDPNPRPLQACRRLLVGQRVRLELPGSLYHGRTGLMQLHFHMRDYTKVTVRFADGHEEYVSATQVSPTTSLY